ncbi:MAG TPA: ArsI/CadI family heavy metal resistance metalloenzyme [Methylophilus sp.]|mgnify:CR=1 FL=1|nr:ArsI/CadI family heavy metal resistance metalloenzyme [Methylophilus sp.]HQQ33734.1 ArsI/CadI family heavy metal resistance metalloenzyme [Methylophilus sp.]
MKRLHLHISVQDLAQSIQFYSTLFGVPPSVEKPDYAKWMLDDPLVNFAISQRGARVGLDHLGIQVDSDKELAEIKTRLEAANVAMLTQAGTTCCYAKSDKHWLQDPSGLAWEAYHTLESALTFNDSHDTMATNSSCCAPTPQTIQFSIKREKHQHDDKPSCG